MSSSSPFATAAAELGRGARWLAGRCWHHGTASTLWALRALRGLIGLIVVAWSVLLIAWLALYWGILPYIEQWRPQVEQRATQALGVPVRIGHIEVRSRGWVPLLELRDVVLLDPQGREALRLPRVAAAVSARSLLALHLRFEQLLVDEPQLDVRRDAQGKLWVAGLDVGAGRSDANPDAATQWLFEQGEFVIRGGALRWTDEQRGAPPLALSDVEFVVRNGLRRHDLRLDATPPPEWGERLSLRGKFQSPLLASAGDWRRWSGSMYAELPRARLDNLRQHVSLPFQLTQGEGSLRAWLDVIQGEARGLTLDVALHQVQVRLTPEVDPLAFADVQGRLAFNRTDDGFRASASNFGFLTGDGVRWPRGDMALAVRQRAPGKAAPSASAPASAAGLPALDATILGGEFSAQQLDVGLMAKIAERVPLPEGMRRVLAEADPHGTISGLTARWDGPLEQPQHYQVKARMAGLSMAAKPAQPAQPAESAERAASSAAPPGRPGWRNADIELQANEKGGDAQLVIRNGALDFPGVFSPSLVPVDQFDAKIAWRIDARAAGKRPTVEVKVRDVRFANNDASGEANATWTTGPGEGTGRGGRYPGRLELSGKLSQARAASVARYLPLGIPEEPRSYVAQSVKSGSLSNVVFKVKGDLGDFPYAGVKQGEFHIAGHLDDATLAYVPPEPGHAQPLWPEFTKLSADLVFDRASMEIRNAQAQVYGVGLSRVQGVIRDLGHNATLVIDGQARGPLPDLLRYVQSSPVGGWLHQALGQTTASGNADLKLALSLPLNHIVDSTVKGSVTLSGNDLRLAPEVPAFGATRGRVDFTHKGMTIVGGAARILGGDASFDGTTLADGSLRFNGQGTVTAEGLRRASELGTLARLGASLSGQTAYRIALNVTRGQTEVNLTSNLVGLALDLPAPLKKSADTPLALRYQTTLLPGSTGAPPRDQMRLELGNVVQAQFVRDLSHDAPQVLRGGVGVFEPAPQPASGVVANLTLPKLNVDAWQALVARVGGSSSAPAGNTGTAGANMSPNAIANPNAGDGYMPQSVALRAQELVVSSRTLTHVVAGASRDVANDGSNADNTWRANLEADQLGGYVEYRPSRSGAGAGRVYGRLSRLALPKGEADSVESLLDTSPSASVPALDIVVDDFELSGKKLGRVEIEAVNRREDAQREWRLNKLNLITPEARLSGNGQWASVPGSPKRRMVLDFKLELSDSGAFLQRLTNERALRGGKGRLQGQLSWSGSPLALDYPSLAGQVNIALEGGQFLKAEPGAARLLGVLSLQALPRRLALDFRDVFQEGFAFDSVSGDVKIDRGQASTNNLRMRGVQAVVLMEGKADLERETQDLRVVVVPEINAGTASLAYAAINPALGLGTFLAQLVLRKPIIAASTREFRVTGPWVDPKVDRVERKPGDPVPTIPEAEPPPNPKS